MEWQFHRLPGELNLGQKEKEKDIKREKEIIMSEGRDKTKWDVEKRNPAKLIDPNKKKENK